MARKASDLSAADWPYQTQVKKYRIFSRLLLRLFLGLKVLVSNHRLHDDKSVYYSKSNLDLRL
mgnify:CR=1 FL=1